MLCKWCGMESATTDQCSWCHRPLTGAAPDNDTAAVEEPRTQSRAPVSLRKVSSPIPASDPPGDVDQIPQVGGGSVGARAPWMSAPPIPPNAIPGSSGADTPAKPIGGPNKPGMKGGLRLPAPGMPPIRSSPAVPKAIPAVPHRHVPAPAILPISQQNRTGGAIPKSPYAAPGPAMAGPRPPETAPQGGRTLTSEPDMSSAQAHAASIADGMPVAEPGGLADGMAAPRTFSAAAEINLPAMDAAGSEQSKYYPGQVVDAISGTQQDATSSKAAHGPSARKRPEMEIEWESPATSLSTLVVRYLFAFAGVLAITCLLAHAYKDYYVVTMLAALFFSGVLLPIMNVVPKQRDDSDDVGIFFGLVMVFGPAIGLVIYAVIGLVKQSANPAVIGCFVVSILTQLAVYLAAPTKLLFGPPWVQIGFDLKTLFINWAAFASIAGWAAANVFHRFDE